MRDRALRRKSAIFASAWVIGLSGAMAAAGQLDERTREFLRESARVHELFKERKYEEAAALCRKLVFLVPHHPSPHYNLACALAQLGKKDDALAALEMAVLKGFNQPEHIEQDDDLAALRDEPRFARCVEKAKEYEQQASAGPYEPGEEIPGVKTVEGSPEGGLRYRLRMSPTATAKQPDRLIIWLHPAGGSANRRVEPMARRFVKLGYALMVLTQKDWRFWSAADMKKLLSATLPDVAKLPGIDAERPILMGYSAGGQAALGLWRLGPGRLGGLVLDAAYPVQRTPGGIGLMPLPNDPAVKRTPFFVLVGEQDGGSKVWRKAAPIWRRAGVPLTIHTIPGKGHAWLFGPKQLDDLEAWLKQVKAGKLPTDPPPAETEQEPD
jgi:pimeloyl-ACP methyl ester carboxylesterase